MLERQTAIKNGVAQRRRNPCMVVVAPLLHRATLSSLIRKSVQRFSEKIMLNQKAQSAMTISSRFRATAK
jgi:hypothetical protein